MRYIAILLLFFLVSCGVTKKDVVGPDLRELDLQDTGTILSPDQNP